MEDVPFNLEHVCRLCDRFEPKMHNIFDKVEEGQQIVCLIKECIPLIVYRKDPLSKYVCEKCLSCLKRYTEFRKKSLETFRKHKSQLERSGTPTNAVILFLKTLQSDHLEEKEFAEEPPPPPPPPPLHNRPANRDITLTNICTLIDSQTLDIYKENSLNASTSRSVQTRRSSNKKIVREKSFHINNSLVGPSPKRRRLVGPKSEMMKYADAAKKRNSRLPTPSINYNPLSLLNAALNVINSNMLSNYDPQDYTRTESAAEERKFACNHCGVKLDTIVALAKHDATHLLVAIGPKVNDVEIDVSDRRATAMPSSDSSETLETSEQSVHNLLIPVENVSDSNDDHDIVMLDGFPSVNGKLLRDYSKEERRTFYRSITHNGIKRKFCNVCRYTFKDNWAIEAHYFSGACYYTCRFCGARFTKYKEMFAEHLKSHDGQEPSSKIFGQVARRQKTNPYVKRRLIQIVPPKVKPIKVKQLLMKHNMIKTEPVARDTENPRAATKNHKNNNKNSSSNSNKSYQAYFCRKCYKVFYQLNEFDEHVLNCVGQTQTKAKPDKPRISSNSLAKPTLVQNNEIVATNSSNDECPILDHYPLSTSGRPIRNCVREIKHYPDEPVLEPQWFAADAPKSKLKVSIKNSKGHACGICTASFPTHQSRNSHMRIHKNNDETKTGAAPPPILPQSHNIAKNKVENVAKKAVQVLRFDMSGTAATLKPVSDNPTQGNSGFSNIMKLVQNNPHLTIRSMSKSTVNVNKMQVKLPSPPPLTRMSPAPPQLTKFSSGPPPLTKLSIPSAPPPLTNLSGVAVQFPPITITQRPTVSQMSSSESENRTYRCQGCHKPFANKSNLYFHKKNYCSGSRFPCPMCKKRFGSEEAYTSHMYYSHPE